MSDMNDPAVTTGDNPQVVEQPLASSIAEPTPAPGVPTPEPAGQPSVTPVHVEPTNTPQPEPPHYEYPTMQNADAQSIINVFAEKNLDPAILDTVFSKALQTGNVEDVDQDALRNALGASADLVMGMARKVAADNQRASEQAAQEVYSQFGSKDAWEAMVAWAHSKSDADQAFAAKLKTYRTMIDAGGEQRRLAVQALKDTYMNDPNVTVHPQLLTGDQPAGGTVGKPINTAREYSELLQAAFKAKDQYAVTDIQNRWRAGGGNPNAPKPVPGFPY